MVAEEATRTSEYRTFVTLQSFARALSHAMRTPLGVISNDLHYLASRHDDGVLDTTQHQCRRIVDLLDLAGSLGAGAWAPTETSLAEIAQTAALTSVPIAVLGNTSIRIRVDRARFSTALKLAALLTTTDALPATVTLRGESNGVRCLVHAQHSSEEAAADPATLVTLWPDRIEAPLLATLIEAHLGVFELISRHTIVFHIPEYRR